MSIVSAPPPPIRAPQKFVPVTSGLFRSEPVPHDVLGNDARYDKVQQIIFTTGLSAAAAHLEATKWMSPNHCARAGAIDVHISSYDFCFCAFDIRRTTRENARSQSVVGAVSHGNRFSQVANLD